MNIFTNLALIVCIVGLIAYVIDLHPKVTRIGEIMFGVALLAWLLGK